MDKSKLIGHITLAQRESKLAPAPMTLTGQPGKRVVINAAKRVIAVHGEVIRALAKR